MLTINKTYRFHTILVLLGLIAMSGCSDIRLKPKDPQLLSLGKFAEQVTKHLLDRNPSTYENYQAALVEELSPDTLTQLQANGRCAKSASDALKVAREADKNGQRCIIQIESTSFPAQTTSTGLVPIEVKGSSIKSENYISRGSSFDVLYFIGTNVKTKRPIVASIEIKQL
jgi:hypothetical protein